MKTSELKKLLAPVIREVVREEIVKVCNTASERVIEDVRQDRKPRYLHRNEQQEIQCDLQQVLQRSKHFADTLFADEESLYQYICECLSHQNTRRAATFYCLVAPQIRMSLRFETVESEEVQNPSRKPLGYKDDPNNKF